LRTPEGFDTADQMAVENLLVTLSRPPLGPARVPNPDGLLAETRHDDYHCRAMATYSHEPLPERFAQRSSSPGRFVRGARRIYDRKAAALVEQEVQR
jgi:hypothetical protein